MRGFFLDAIEFPILAAGMQLSALVFVALTALLHLYFMILEMFFWTKPFGLKVFGQSMEAARSSAVLAANQGLYNGFLSAGLIWGLLNPTVNRKILLIQAGPAVLAVVFTLLA